ncbi:hypothetical protein caldi_30060 [Caldinitratiruptor microaerophilus]|uniref:Lipoprotein n=1 Tax=Caldinitratiruptor microaerophilus TaxID=671077 RepID=A0AA35CQ61_9FIRM|nr:hypothetical protein caldi_30060 [Caldinitratiruptor microaerophilus]
MRRVHAVAVVGMGLFTALFSGATACGCKDAPTRSVQASFSQPPHPDVPLKIIKVEKSGVSFQTQDSGPPKLPEPPPLPPGTTAGFVRSTRDGASAGELVSPPSLSLDLEVRLPEDVPPDPRRLVWPPGGMPTYPTDPKVLPPPVSIRVLEGDAVVEMVPIQGEPATFGRNYYWILGGLARARISWGPVRDGMRQAPALPARLVLAPVIKLDGEEVMGQPVEITIRLLPQAD